MTEVAIKQKNWSLLASVYANEIFHNPDVSQIAELLIAVSKCNCEPQVRREITQYLETGKVPDAITQMYSNKKVTPAAKKNWPIEIITGNIRPLNTKPRIDILCKWAINENRPADAVKWYQQCTANERLKLGISLVGIIEKTNPDLAIEIYIAQANAIVGATKRYEYHIAVSYLAKAKRIYEQTGRVAQWVACLEKIRSENKRKHAFIAELKGIDSGSIVDEKMKKNKK